MKVKALMLAFGEGQTREINIPDEVNTADTDGLLEWAFYYGQNEFQRVKNCPSVSVGDVIELPDGRYFIVRSLGFGRITPKELEEDKSQDRRTRGISALLD